MAAGRRVVVTGAGGFVGQAACAALLDAGHAVHALTRRPFELRPPATGGFTQAVVEDLASARLDELLAGADAIVHLAARVHRVAERGTAGADAYARDVAIATALAEAARRAGARRFVFLSSIKALGDRTPHGPFERTTRAAPVDPYGRSKLAIEQQLEAFSAASGLETVVVRAPLVYGAAAGANFRELVRWVRRGVPLPLAAVSNRRSIVCIDNLTDFLVRCLGAVNGTFNLFHVADAQSVSTPGLLRHVAAALGRPPRLYPVPPELLHGLCRLLGREDLAVRLLMSLEFAIADSCAALSWRPPTATGEGIARAVRAMSW